MEYSIDSHNLRSFTKVIQCLAKFGDELIMVAHPINGITFTSKSPTRSAFCSATFRRKFFKKFNVVPPLGQDILEIQLVARHFVSILRHRGLTTSVHECIISIKEERRGPQRDDCIISRLLIRLQCQHGVVKLHQLTYAKPLNLIVDFNKDICPSFWSVNARTLKDWTEHFWASSKHGTEQITLIFMPITCILKTTSDSDAESKSGPKPISTTLTASVEEFEQYHTNECNIGCPITFSLKEFKAVINLGDGLTLPLDAYFGAGGDPLLLEINSTDLFVCQFTLATNSSDPSFNGDNDNQQQRASFSRHNSNSTGITTTNLPAQRAPFSRQNSNNSGILSNQPPQRIPLSRHSSSTSGVIANRTQPQQSNSSARTLPTQQLSNPQAQNEKQPLFMPASQASQQSGMDEYDAELEGDDTFEQMLIASQAPIGDSNKNNTFTKAEWNLFD